MRGGYCDCRSGNRKCDFKSDINTKWLNQESFFPEILRSRTVLRMRTPSKIYAASVILTQKIIPNQKGVVGLLIRCDEAIPAMPVLTSSTAIIVDDIHQVRRIHKISFFI